ncbi:ubiquitin-associated and SH3 domain-containing protein A-like isoform X2 [Narcine bancroftii]|uniref:ubiquitin-associated and SH3 domain-containing protein A-like isoform X2 n=1 Tax=Narcine bancroftii TaxID=1343680 RepID=UPI00383118F5
MAEYLGRLATQAPTQLHTRSPGSLLESLLSQGFHENLAQKALAATGRVGPQEASEWILTHQNDPTRDDPIPQEYVMYLIPSGTLWDKLMVFWTESQTDCGRNGAHEVFPHISLCHFFTCEDSKLERLYKALKKTGDRFVDRFPSRISLTLHTSSCYIGFFLDQASADIIKQFALTFRETAAKLADCQLDLSSKPLHLTLAHSFLPHHQLELEAKARCISLGLSCQWKATLYSRDMRFAHYQVLQALYPYNPQNDDELRLDPSDYVFMHPTEQEGVSEGWVFGTSHRTGCMGVLPGNYVDEAPESGTWVKHRSYAFRQTRVEASNGNRYSALCLEPAPHQAPSSIHRLLEAQLQATASSRRWLLFVRHGESVDLVFGKAWIEQCFSEEGRYFRGDLNFPRSVPWRAGGARDYRHDAPLSSCGIFQSQLMGEAMADREIGIWCVYSSPALRCVHTAHYLLEGLKPSSQVGIRLEPGLFEWTTWEAKKPIPNFMSVAELEAAGYSVDGTYRFLLSQCAAV